MRVVADQIVAEMTGVAAGAAVGVCRLAGTTTATKTTGTKKTGS